MNADRIIPLVLWPVALMMVFHRSVILVSNGHRTDDFVPVYNAALNFLRRLPVYEGNLTTVDPHYLYPPSGTLLMAPLAIIDPERSRWIFVAFSVGALILSAYLLVRMFGHSPKSWLFPTLVFAFFLTESIANTLIFTNSNAFVLLGLVLFLQLMLNRQDLWAGVAIGLTLAFKPVLGPLLLLALLNRQWRVLVTAIGIPVLLTALAWPMSVDPEAFITNMVPYLLETRDYYNSSISGNGLYFGISSWLILALRLAFVAMAAFGLWFLYRYYRKSDPLLWLTTSSGILLVTTFLTGSLGQGYYSMLLFPLLLTVLLAGSTVRNWPAWLGAYGCLSFDAFYLTRIDWEALGRRLEYHKVTWGWSLLAIAVFCSLLFRYLDMRKAGVTDTPDEPAKETTSSTTPKPDHAQT